MTGPDDSGPSGIFDHLDDPGAPAPSQDLLAAVVHRGRRIRARRQGAIAMSGAAAITAAVIAGLGLSHAVNADRDSIFTPANTPTPSFSASAGPHRSHSPGVAVVVPHGRPASSPASPSLPPSPEPCDSMFATATPSPLVNGPIVESSVPPLLPTSSPPACTSDSPSPSPTPSETASPEPTTTGEPTSSPSPEPAPTP